MGVRGWGRNLKNLYLMASVFLVNDKGTHPLQGEGAEV